VRKIHLDPDLVRKVVLDPENLRKTMCEILGVSEAKLRQVMRELGLPVDKNRKRVGANIKTRKNIPEEAVRDLIEVKKLTQDEVCEKLGCGMNCLRRLMHKYGIQPQRTGPRSGEGHYHSWRGGRVIDKDGYVLLYKPDHPSARSGTYVAEHRLVMEAHLGRYLKKTEVVHHKDGNPLNNSLDNLELFANNAEHLRHELGGKPYGQSTRPGTLKRRTRLKVVTQTATPLV